MPLSNLVGILINNNNNNSTTYKKRPFFWKQNGNKKRNQSVTFCDQNIIYNISEHSQINKEELWYSKSDFKSISFKNAQIVEFVRNGDFIESEHETFLGLEPLLHKESIELKRDHLYNVIMMEQLRQSSPKHSGNDQRLAQIYRKNIALYSNSYRSR